MANFDEFSRGLPLRDSVSRPVKRVQLIFPPMVFSRFQSRQTAMFPLGLGYIAAVLERDGYEVSVVDCPIEGYSKIIDIHENLSIYGLSAEEIQQRIEQFRPEVVGISCLFSTLEKRMLFIAQIAKKVDPNIVVICGGPHVSAYYQRLIRNPLVDYCVIGEGEDVISDLLKTMNSDGRKLSDVHAIAYRRGGQVIYQPRQTWIQKLDEIPFPARHLGPHELYYTIGKVQGLRTDGEKRLRLEQMTTSRGCPFRCTYCAKSVTWGTSFRTRSAKNVLDEIEHLVETYGVERIAFQDDNFTADMTRAAEIFDGIVIRGMPITWEAHNGLGVSFLDDELLEKMKASGCIGFTIAVESANTATLKRVKKPNFTKMAPPIVAKAKELGIEVRGFFMIGFPGETIDDVYRTTEYARNLDLAVTAFALVTPLPGTQLYQECVAAGMIDESQVDFEEFSFGAFDLQLSEVPVETLKAIRKVEWLKTVLLNQETGELKSDIKMSRADMIEEIDNGIRLFPENGELKRIYKMVQLRH